jgi:hypothetical protein
VEVSTVKVGLLDQVVDEVEFIYEELHSQFVDGFIGQS